MRNIRGRELNSNWSRFLFSAYIILPRVGVLHVLGMTLTLFFKVLCFSKWVKRRCEWNTYLLVDR